MLGPVVLAVAVGTKFDRAMRQIDNLLLVNVQYFNPHHPAHEVEVFVLKSFSRAGPLCETIISLPFDPW